MGDRRPEQNRLFREGVDRFLGLNVGGAYRFGEEDARWRLRGEIGSLINLDEGGVVWAFELAASYAP